MAQLEIDSPYFKSIKLMSSLVLKILQFQKYYCSNILHLLLDLKNVLLVIS